MFDFLDKIRTMPAHMRRRYAAAAAVTCTALVFVVWLGFGPFGPHVSGTISDHTPRPLSALNESIDTIWNKLMGAVVDAKGQFQEFGREMGQLASSTFATTTVEITNAISDPSRIMVTTTYATTSFATSTKTVQE